MALKPFEKGGDAVGVLEKLGVDPFGADLDAVGYAAVGQGLGDGFVGVLELGVFADDGDAHLALGIVDAVDHVLPYGKIGFRRGRNAERVEHRLVHAGRVIGQRRLVNRAQIRSLDHRIQPHVAEEREFVAFLLRDRML